MEFVNDVVGVSFPVNAYPALLPINVEECKASWEPIADEQDLTAHYCLSRPLRKMIVTAPFIDFILAIELDINLPRETRRRHSCDSDAPVGEVESSPRNMYALEIFSDLYTPESRLNPTPRNLHERSTFTGYPLSA